MLVTLRPNGVKLKGRVRGDPSRETYEGDYIVTPLAYEDQTLETALKYLTDNVTVTSIPYSEVSNPAGGITFSIG